MSELLTALMITVQFRSVSINVISLNQLCTVLVLKLAVHRSYLLLLAVHPSHLYKCKSSTRVLRLAVHPSHL